MPTLHNRITINAPREVIWKYLAEMDQLAWYDPAVASSRVLSGTNHGVGSIRRVEMKDGNWFEEKCQVYIPNKSLEYQLTSCSFPVKSLSHNYSFKKLGHHKYEVSQHQAYKMKFGIFGLVMGTIIKSRWNQGIKAFLKGLKHISEHHI